MVGKGTKEVAVQVRDEEMEREVKGERIDRWLLIIGNPHRINKALYENLL